MLLDLICSISLDKGPDYIQYPNFNDQENNSSLHNVGWVIFTFTGLPFNCLSFKELTYDLKQNITGKCGGFRMLCDISLYLIHCVRFNVLCSSCCAEDI